MLGWNAVPGAIDQAADFVLGQANLTSYASGAGASGMSGPLAVTGDGSHLYVADTGNARLMAWSTVPTATAPATSVFGQASLTSAGGPSHGEVTSATTVSAPSGMYADGLRVFVADPLIGRVLVVPAF